MPLESSIMTVCALLADIGGTNIRLTLQYPNGQEASTEVLQCADFASMSDAVEAYLDAVKPEQQPEVMALATASGGMEGEYIKFTNQPWEFYRRDVIAQFKLKDMHIVNDFAAIALAVPLLEDQHKLQIGLNQDSDAQPEYSESTVYSVLGPGTGLGVATVVPLPDGTPYVLSPNEGGHCTIPPMTEKESGVLAILRRQYNHVSAERVVSGMGIVNIYQAICRMSDVDPLYDQAAAISKAALEDSDARCLEALDMFCAFLGTAASNICLITSSFNGVYLAGGIIPKLGDFFHTSRFRKRFETKGRFSHFLEATPTYLMTHPLPAMLGLKYLVQTKHP